MIFGDVGVWIETPAQTVVADSIASGIVKTGLDFDREIGYRIGGDSGKLDFVATRGEIIILFTGREENCCYKKRDYE